MGHISPLGQAFSGIAGWNVSECERRIASIAALFHLTHHKFHPVICATFCSPQTWWQSRWLIVITMFLFYLAVQHRDKLLFFKRQKVRQFRPPNCPAESGVSSFYSISWSSVNPLYCWNNQKIIHFPLKANNTLLVRTPTELVNLLFPYLMFPSKLNIFHLSLETIVQFCGEALIGKLSMLNLVSIHFSWIFTKCDTKTTVVLGQFHQGRKFMIYLSSLLCVYLHFPSLYIPAGFSHIILWRHAEST